MTSFINNQHNFILSHHQNDQVTIWHDTGLVNQAATRWTTVSSFPVTDFAFSNEIQTFQKWNNIPFYLPPKRKKKKKKMTVVSLRMTKRAPQASLIRSGAPPSPPDDASAESLSTLSKYI